MRIRYEDPTGGGDDIFLELPENSPWTKGPSIIILEDSEGELHTFHNLGDEK